MTQSFDQNLWEKLVATGKKLERKQTHGLHDVFVETVLATLDYYDASEEQLKLAGFDLYTAKYKIWDWLGMCLTGRLGKEKDLVYSCIENMARLYILQNDVGGWAWWLRGHDLDVEEPHRCEDCIKSYHDWMKEVFE